MLQEEVMFELGPKGTRRFTKQRDGKGNPRPGATLSKSTVV